MLYFSSPELHHRFAWPLILPERKFLSIFGMIHIFCEVFADHCSGGWRISQTRVGAPIPKAPKLFGHFFPKKHDEEILAESGARVPAPPRIHQCIRGFDL